MTSDYGTFHGAWMVLWIVVWWLLGLVVIGLVRLFPHPSLRKLAQAKQEGLPSKPANR